MDDKRMMERVHRAVEQRCEPLKPDPLLAARVMRMAEHRGEMKVKRKLSVGFALCILMVLLSVTAIAAVLLSGMEIVEQKAVPAAQENDGAVRRNEMYSHEELVNVLTIAAENGVSLENDYFIMEALARGEGYAEEEVIMAICREAFGGLYYEWTVEEQYWYEEMMVRIGFQNENLRPLPGEGQIAPAEARTLALTLLESEFGAVPLTDPDQYRTVEDFNSEGWYFTYYPLSLTAPEYHVHFTHDQSVVETHCTPQSWETYSEQQLQEGINRVYGYRTYTQQNWGLEGWYTFGQMLPAAIHTTAWSAEYDGYLATTYLLPQEGDITAAEAKAIAMKDAEIDLAIKADTLLLGQEDERIWKVTLRFLNAENEVETRSWEINAATGEICHRMTLGEDTLAWARYMLYETYTAVVHDDMMTAEKAKEIAIADLRERFGNLALPFDDPDIYDITVRTLGDGERYSVIFNTKSLDYGRCSVYVNADGTTKLNYASLAPLNADNLNDRFDDVYGSNLRWDQSLWVQFDQMLDTLGEPLTFEGKLFAATSYPDASTVSVTLDEALDAVQAHLGTLAEDPISWVLIDAVPHPVWKIRMGTYPANTLYEVDAMTGEILDEEIYVIQRDDFDHSMKMFTLRSTYMPAALAEFGPARIAMELTVKANFDLFSADEAVFMDKSAYTVTVDGMTVTFTSIGGTLPSYRTTILDSGLDAQIEVFNIPEPTPVVEGPVGGNG